MSFRKWIKEAINMYSKENGSNTPDCILAQYLEGCLKLFDVAVQQRENWYGRGTQPKECASKFKRRIK